MRGLAGLAWTKPSKVGMEWQSSHRVIAKTVESWQRGSQTPALWGLGRGFSPGLGSVRAPGPADSALVSCLVRPGIDPGPRIGLAPTPPQVPVPTRCEQRADASACRRSTAWVRSDAPHNQQAPALLGEAGVSGRTTRTSEPRLRPGSWRRPLGPWRSARRPARRGDPAICART